MLTVAKKSCMVKTMMNNKSLSAGKKLWTAIMVTMDGVILIGDFSEDIL